MGASRVDLERYKRRGAQIDFPIFGGLAAPAKTSPEFEKFTSRRRTF
jgi:hypothetical protein